MKKLVLLFATCFGLHSAIGQPVVPVDLLTGRAQISIPIAQVSDGRISVPVSFNYDATGVKVTAGNRDVGMGWSLSAGGGVSRRLRGLPDDYFGNPSDGSDARRGWLHVESGTMIGNSIHSFSQTSDASFGTYTDEWSDYNYLTGLNCLKDTEPDIFTFSAPGLSGGFVFGADGLPKPVPYQDIKITINSGFPVAAPITAIYITKNDGTKYTFSATSKLSQRTEHDQVGFITQFYVQRELFKKITSFTTDWELYKIETPAGESIVLSYKPERHNTSRDNIAISKVGAPEPDTTWYYDQQFTTRKVRDIESKTTKVELTWGGNDEELIDVKVIDKTSGRVKDFNFFWTDISGTDNVNRPTTRKFLTSVYESASCDRFPAYTFEYYGVTGNTISIPFNNPKVKSDIWGYFNDNATNNNPTVYFFADKNGSDRYRFYPISGQTPTATISGGSDRAVNSSKVMYGTLKRINYPAGGYADIVYEPNAYYDVVANTTNYGPGLRVKQVTTVDPVASAPNTVIDYEYKMSDNSSSGKWVYRSAFGYHDVSQFYSTGARDNSPEPQIMYERVSVVQSGKGKLVTEYLLPGMDPVTSGTGDYSDWNAARTYVARSTNHSEGQLTMNYYQMPFAPNVTYDFERGLVSKMQTYNQAGTLIHEKLYSYQRLATSSVVVKGLRYEWLRNSSDINIGGSNPMFVFSHYPVLANAGRVIQTETERVADMSDASKWHETSTSYTFNSTHHMLSMTALTNSDGIQHRTKFRYAKDFASLTNPLSTDANALMLKKLNDDFMHGSPIATISATYNGSTETITGAAVTLYASFSDSLGVARPLPVETKVTNGVSGWSEPVVSPSSGSNQVLATSGTYLTTSKIEQYDFIGTPLTVRTREKTLNGVHMGYRKSLPVAAISNAGANEVVYDGFETYTGFGFTVTQPTPPATQYTWPAGWTGKKGLAMPASGSIQKSGILKGKGKYYRYTIRASRNGSGTISFRIYNGATHIFTETINHSASDTNWKFYEGRIDMTSAATAPSTFILKIENNNAIVIDDVAFYPESASLSSFTYEPMLGRTSETDTRGVSIFYEYDQLGRIVDLKDQDKTLRQHTDYYYRTQPTPQLHTNFNSTHEPYQVVTGAVVTYTPPTTECLSGVTYDWYVNGAKIADNSTSFQYTFSSSGIYVVKMVAEHVSYGSASSQIVYDVKTIGTGPITATTSTSSLIYTNCDANHSKTFTTTLGGCYVGEDVVINWYYKLGGSTWTLLNAPTTQMSGNTLATISSDYKTMTFDPLIAFNGLSNLNDYQIKCEVSAVCPTDLGDNFGIVHADSEEKSIDFQYNANCL